MNDQPPVGMNLGFAIQELKAGKRIARYGWSDKSMSLEFVPDTAGPDPVDPLYVQAWEIFPRVDMYRDSVNGSRSMVAGWLPSRDDLLTDDWFVAS